MKSNRDFSWLMVAIALVVVSVAQGPKLLAQTSGNDSSSATQWSVKVDKVDPGDLDLEPAFQVAIYENIVNQLTKTKRFSQVLRDGDRSASGVPGLLILKTTVQKYTPGSQTRREVTTVSGATRLTVRAQLCTRDGKVVFEHTVNGNVRFFGSNLRATQTLARNVAKAIKQSVLPEPALAISTSGS